MKLKIQLVRNLYIFCLFCRLPVVLVYQLDSATLTFVQRLDLEGRVWDLTFDLEGHLLVFQVSQGRPLVAYSYSQQHQVYIVVLSI